MLHTRVTIELVHFVILPNINSLSTTLSPRTILTCVKINFTRYYHLPCSSYAPAREETLQTQMTPGQPV